MVCAIFTSEGAHSVKYQGVHRHLTYVTCTVTVFRHISSPQRTPGRAKAPTSLHIPNSTRVCFFLSERAAFFPGETNCLGAMSTSLPWCTSLALCAGNSQHELMSCPRQRTVSFGNSLLLLSEYVSMLWGLIEFSRRSSEAVLFTQRFGFFACCTCIMCVKQKKRALYQPPKPAMSVKLSADAKIVAVGKGYGVSWWHKKGGTTTLEFETFIFKGHPSRYRHLLGAKQHALPCPLCGACCFRYFEKTIYPITCLASRFHSP